MINIFSEFLPHREVVAGLRLKTPDSLLSIFDHPEITSVYRLVDDPVARIANVLCQKQMTDDQFEEVFEHCHYNLAWLKTRLKMGGKNSPRVTVGAILVGPVLQVEFELVTHFD